MSSARRTSDEPPYLVLVNLADPKQTYDLLRKKTNAVARAGFGDLEIHGDLSVSRCHASISCIKKTIGGEVKMFMRVLDKNSKFGTYVNDGITLNQRIEHDCPIILSHGDKIRFGLTDRGCFQLWVRSFNVCVSAFTTPNRVILERTLAKSKGINMQCDIGKRTTHLCMTSITVTEKALISLASLRPIVTIQYFIDLYNALLPNSSTELPFTADYLPPSAERLLNQSTVSLDINNKRKVLFSGKTFVCSSEGQIKRFVDIVKAAGGNLLHHVDSHNMTMNDILNSDDFLFLQQDKYSTEIDDKYQQMLTKLVNKRPISENEIGLAIIYASTEKHCNPQYYLTWVKQSQPSATEIPVPSVLALDTEEITVVENNQMFSLTCLPDSLACVPDSLTCVPDSLTCVPDSLSQTKGLYKRPLEVIMDSDDMVPNKRAVPNAVSNEEVINNFSDMGDIENVQPLSRVAKPKKTIVHDMSINSDSCVTQVPSSLDISKENDLSNLMQVSIAKKNINNTNNFHSNTIKTDEISNKRMISSVPSNTDEDDPFDYMDIDEIEEIPKKKKKVEDTESVFHSMEATSSNNKNIQPTFEKSKTFETIDPPNIMNLLADVKGTCQFIDSSKIPDKSCITYREDPEYKHLLNSVVVETVSMVVSRPIQTQQSLQNDNSGLKNFKKFKKKGPAMTIPHIIPLKISDAD